MLSKFCRTSNIEIHYLEGGEGESVILLPGIWTTSKSFEEIGGLLCESFHVIIPDLFKGKSKFINTVDSVAAYSDALQQLVENLNIKRFSLVGWSIGGLIASCYAQKHPSGLNRLIFICTSTMHLDFMEKPNLILKGYIKLFINNLFTLPGIRILFLWMADALEYFLRHPSQFAKEIRVGMYDDLFKAKKMPVPSILLIAKNDEFAPFELIKDANQDIENLDIEIVNGYHDWFFHDKELFLEKIRQFLKDYLRV